MAYASSEEIVVVLEQISRGFNYMGYALEQIVYRTIMSRGFDYLDYA